MTSSDWAAWVQAVGSIGAIVAAAIIASRQHRATVRRDKAAAEQQTRLTARHCVAFASHLLACIAELQQSLQWENAEMGHRQESRLRDLAQFAQSIPLFGLPAEAVISFLDLRAVAAEALSDASGALCRGWEDSLPSLQSQFERHLKRASKAAQELHDQLDDLLRPTPHAGSTEDGGA